MTSDSRLLCRPWTHLSTEHGEQSKELCTCVVPSISATKADELELGLPACPWLCSCVCVRVCVCVCVCVCVLRGVCGRLCARGCVCACAEQGSRRMVPPLPKLSKPGRGLRSLCLPAAGLRVLIWQGTGSLLVGAHTCAHTHTHARTRTRIRTQIQAHTHTCACTHIHTHTRHKHTNTHTRAHTDTHTHIHTQTHTCVHTYLHTDTHTHTNGMCTAAPLPHLPMQPLCCCRSASTFLGGPCPPRRRWM